ncbi:hypothetical protein EDB89DRAFT_2081954 [Lactarius sanguifluus]|nr:hypothetical protein EDB89DRAFT_2081954 [Lactarius sanguifluus]
MSSARRLKYIQNALAASTEIIGTLTLGDISYPVPASRTPSRLPRLSPLDPSDAAHTRTPVLSSAEVRTRSRRLPTRATWALCTKASAHVLQLTERRGREIRDGGNLVYVDSAAVRAVKTGRILIIEGIENAERGIMRMYSPTSPVSLTNPVPGTSTMAHISFTLTATCFFLPRTQLMRALFRTSILPRHRNRRTCSALYRLPTRPALPLALPPARSLRTHTRLPHSSGNLTLCGQPYATSCSRHSSRARRATLDGVTRPALPPFPHTALAKLHALLAAFLPPSPQAPGMPALSPRAMGRLMIVLHPELLHAPFRAWALLSERLEEAGLGPLAAPLATEDPDNAETAAEDAAGLLGHQTPDFVPSARFVGLLTSCLQAHALGWDISLVPPAQPATAIASTSLLVQVFGGVLGYVREAVHVYKELGGRELLMRRVVGEGGATSWEPRCVFLHREAGPSLSGGAYSPLVQGAWAGRLVHFSGFDVLGPTAGAIARLLQDREVELWEGKRIVASPGDDLGPVRSDFPSLESFTETCTRRRTTPILLSPTHPSALSAPLRALRDWLSAEHANMFLTLLAQPMGRSEEAALLLRTGCPLSHVDALLGFAGTYRTPMAPSDGALRVRRLGTRALLRIARRLARFPWDQDTRRMLERALLTDFLPATEKVGVEELLEDAGIKKISPAFHPAPLIEDRALLFPDPEGAGSYVPFMDHFYDNSIQSAQMRDLAIDFELLGEHLVLLGNQGELTLSDGRRLARVVEREGDLPIHPRFRLILLANRPGYPFLGNHFMQVLGDNFSCHAISNPDLESERKLLTQLAPELSEDLIVRLIGAFHGLRQSYEGGTLSYPYSLRGIPRRELDDTLRNVFDFDVYRIETTEKLDEILRKHGSFTRIWYDATTRKAKKPLEMQFDPQETDLDKPKHGQEDPSGEAHTGGNTFAGGTGGRDTAGLGGRGGFKRSHGKDHDINQISNKLKEDVPESVREQARLMARKELEARLAELNMTSAGADSYGALLTAVQAHIAQLHDLLERAPAREEERVWVKRQTDGELDDTRLTEGLTGEAAVYKRRGMAKPELGRPQVKPKRIRFLSDISASMYRFQYDGRLQRSLETAVMLMESFNVLSRKDKYAWDMYGHSGDEPEIPLVKVGDSVEEVSERWAVAQKMKYITRYITQYTFSGDSTGSQPPLSPPSIEKAVDEVAAFDGGTFSRIGRRATQYRITKADLGRVMNRHPKVKTALICICEDSEAAW